LIDADFKVIAGHGRVLACQLLGRSEVPTICLDHLTEAQKRAFMIADNRLTENSIWDDKLLAEHLRELSEIELDFDLEITGFDVAEIDFRIQQLTEEKDEADALPTSSGPGVTRGGDLWLLGEHRVLCANALDVDAYRVLLGLDKAATIFTDPPYNLRIENNVSGLGKVKHRNFPMATGEMSEAEFTLFLSKVCTLFANHSTDGSLHYVFMDWRHLGELLAAGKIAYDGLINIAVWAKSNAGMGSLYRSQHELVSIFKHGRGAHRNNVRLGQYGRNRTNLWNYPSISDFGRKGDEGNLLALHPTVKPVALVADALLDCSTRGDIVLDGFLGSGTTVIAAVRTGRRCFGLELDPKYVDTIIQRYQAFTGDDAIQASSGRTFNDLAGEAEVSDGER
jgi:DNA modification methylase